MWVENVERMISNNVKRERMIDELKTLRDLALEELGVRHIFDLLKSTSG